MKQTIIRYILHFENSLPHSIVLTILLVLLSCTSLQARMSAQDLQAIYETGLIPLTDDQEGVYKAGRDYLVFETMRVKRGDTVEFSPGARIFFHASAKITVHGELKFNGTPEAPITIGKLNVTIPKLSRYSNAPSDSISFYLYRNSSLVMNSVNLIDSTISFRCTDSTSDFVLDSVHCSGNRFSLPDTLLHLWPGSCVNCVRQGGYLSRNCVLPPPPSNTQTIVVKKTLGWSAFKIPVRITLGAGVLAAAGMWYYYYDKELDADKKYSAYVNPDPADRARAERDLKPIKQAREVSRRYRDLAAYAAACGAASLTLTFMFGGNGK